MKSLAIALIVLATTAGAAVADLSITLEYRDLTTTPPTIGEGQMYLAGNKIKMDMPPDTGGTDLNTSMVYNGDTEQVMILDHDRQVYTIIDKSSMEAVSEQLNSAMQEMEKQLAQMPEEQRQMMQKFMKDQMPTDQPEINRPVFKVQKTDRQEKVGDHSCLCYEVLVDGIKSSETWVASWKDAKVDKEAFDVFHQMAEFYRGLLESVPAAGQQAADQDFFGGIDQVDGFPIMIREFEGSVVSGETIFKDIKRQQVAPGTFEAPAGYNKQEMFGRDR